MPQGAFINVFQYVLSLHPVFFVTLYFIGLFVLASSSDPCLEGLVEDPSTQYCQGNDVFLI